MTPMKLIFPFAAALALVGTPALAQHSMPDHSQHPKNPPSSNIAEGVVKDGVRVVEMQVTGDGFVPAKIKVKKGEKLRLVITRKTDRTCATEIVIKGHGINTPLPLDKPVTVELTPKASGEIKYACAMGHIRGVIFVP